MNLTRMHAVLQEITRQHAPELLTQEYIDGAVGSRPAHTRQLVNELTYQLAQRHIMVLNITTLPAYNHQHIDWVNRLLAGYYDFYNLITRDYLPGLTAIAIASDVTLKFNTTVALRVASNDAALAIVGYVMPYVENRQRIHDTRKPQINETRTIIQAVLQCLALDNLTPDQQNAYLQEGERLIHNMCALPVRQEPFSKLARGVVKLYQPPSEAKRPGAPPPPPPPPPPPHSNGGGNGGNSYGASTLPETPLPLERLPQDDHTESSHLNGSTTEQIIKRLKRFKAPKDDDSKIRPPVRRLPRDKRSKNDQT